MSTFTVTRRVPGESTPRRLVVVATSGPEAARIADAYVTGDRLPSGLTHRPVVTR